MRLLLTIFLVALSSSAFSQESKPVNVPTLDPFPTILNKAEAKKKNIAATKADGEVIYKSAEVIERDLKKGIKYYKKENYKKAYKLLSELAQWGIKSPQALVGMMHIKGQHVDQSIEVGLAWLGVANEIDMDESQETYDYIYNQLTDDQKKFIDTKVAKYIEMYGMETQNISCKEHKELGSNIPKKICLKAPGSSSPLYPLE